MQRYLSICILALAAMGFPRYSSGLEIALTYRTHTDRKKGEYVPYGSGEVQKSLECPVPDLEIPELKSEQPIYGIMELGGQRRLIVLDRKDAGDPFYNRIYFDANGNGDLTDDPVLDGRADVSDAPRWVSAGFDPVDTTVRIGEKDLPYSFVPMAYCYDGYADGKLDKEKLQQKFRFRYGVNCSYSGKFELDGEEYVVALGDRNGDGRFSVEFTAPDLDETQSRRSLSLEGDNIYLTSEKKIDYNARQMLGDLLSISGKLYKVEVAPGEKRMTLEPVEEALDTVSFPMEPNRITLFTEDGKHCANLLRPGKKARLPHGQYRLLEYEILRKDDEGDLWRLHAVGTNKSPEIAVGPRGNVKFRFGEPYRPVAQVPADYAEAMEKGKGKDKVYIVFSILGNAEETLDDIARVEGKRTDIEMAKEDPGRPKEPSYEIFDDKGELVTRADFKYG